MRSFALALLFGWLLVGCSSNTPSGQQQKPSSEAATKPATDANKAETGRVAFQRMYVAARGWARDAMPVGLESTPTKDFPGKDGKAGMWRGTFGSASRQAMKPFVWSGINAEDAPTPGINPGSEDSFNANNTSTRPFDLNYLKIDSDKAYEIALAHGGKEFVAKNKDATIRYTLSFDGRSNQLRWIVNMESASAKARPLTMILDASSGEFLKKR
jgi:hypothetical protein